MKKKIYYFILLVFFLVGTSVLVFKTKAQWDVNSLTPLVLGEDDEEDEEDEEDDDEDSASSGSSSPKTVTTYVKLPDQIIKKLIEIVTFDSDGDGVFDPDDATPNLHNVFLVKDDNLNGIVDAYENRE